jgi:hypothetical protein
METKSETTKYKGFTITPSNGMFITTKDNTTGGSYRHETMLLAKENIDNIIDMLKKHAL